MATDKYENLSGFRVNYEDGNLFSGRSLAGTTQSKLIIGSAPDGPVGEPVSVNAIGGVKEAEKLFGGMIDPITKQPKPGTLLRAMHEAIAAGCDDIRLLRVDGARAKTVLAVRDEASEQKEKIGMSDGNTIFTLPLPVDAGAKLSQINRITVTELDQSTKDYDLSVIQSTNYEEGSESVTFYPNKLRPKRTVEVEYDYEIRTYTLVPRDNGSGAPDYSDPDYMLSRTSNTSRYFFSARTHWSDKLESGHIPTVVVTDNNTGTNFTIASMNVRGEYIYRIGQGNTADPLTDMISPEEYIEGGIFFTTAYDAEVAAGNYPALSGNITVRVEYAWYLPNPMTATATMEVPGQSYTRNLSYTPNAEGFRLFYLGSNGAEVNLVSGTDYGLSLTEKKVTITAGAIPAAKEIFAEYKTTSSTISDPYIVVEGKFAGGVYGGIRNVYEPSTIFGVSCEIVADPRDEAGKEKIVRFYKPGSKKLTSRDLKLEYRTLDLRKYFKSMKSFVNFVNNDVSNNIVRLSVPSGFGEIDMAGIQTTGVIDPENADASRQYLGQMAPGMIYEDTNYPLGDIKRYAWLGNDGFYDVLDPKQMLEYHQKLGGRFERDIFGKLVYDRYDNPIILEQGVYQRLENYVVDVIVLADVYANTAIGSFEEGIKCDPSLNFATQLAQHCALVTAKTWETIADINMVPVPEIDLLSLQEYVNLATGYDLIDVDSEEGQYLIDKYLAKGINILYENKHFMVNEENERILDDNGNPIDIGRYLSVVFGPEVALANDKVSDYVTTGAITYGGLITTLPGEESTTNKQLKSVQGLRYSLSEAQHNQLVGARYVTFQEKFLKTSAGLVQRFVVKDGVTASLPNSDYNRLSALRIIHECVQLIRQKADPYIGMPNGLAQRTALNADIQQGLDAYKEAGKIQHFKFTIYSSVQDLVLGNSFITLEVVPQFETRKFHTSVALRAAL